MHDDPEQRYEDMRLERQDAAFIEGVLTERDRLVSAGVCRSNDDANSLIKRAIRVLFDRA